MPNKISFGPQDRTEHDLHQGSLWISNDIDGAVYLLAYRNEEWSTVCLNNGGYWAAICDKPEDAVDGLSPYRGPVTLTPVAQ